MFLDDIHFQGAPSCPYVPSLSSNYQKEAYFVDIGAGFCFFLTIRYLSVQSRILNVNGPFFAKRQPGGAAIDSRTAPGKGLCSCYLVNRPQGRAGKLTKLHSFNTFNGSRTPEAERNSRYG